MYPRKHLRSSIVSQKFKFTRSILVDILFIMAQFHLIWEGCWLIWKCQYSDMYFGFFTLILETLLFQYNVSNITKQAELQWIIISKDINCWNNTAATWEWNPQQRTCCCGRWCKKVEAQLPEDWACCVLHTYKSNNKQQKQIKKISQTTTPKNWQKVKWNT